MRKQRSSICARLSVVSRTVRWLSVTRRPTHLSSEHSWKKKPISQSSDMVSMCDQTHTMSSSRLKLFSRTAQGSGHTTSALLGVRVVDMRQPSRFDTIFGTSSGRKGRPGVEA